MLVAASPTPPEAPVPPTPPTPLTSGPLTSTPAVLTSEQMSLTVPAMSATQLPNLPSGSLGGPWLREPLTSPNAATTTAAGWTRESLGSPIRERSGVTTTSHIIGTKVQREVKPPREIESRVISSKIVEEEFIGKIPADFESQRKVDRLQESVRRVPARRVAPKDSPQHHHHQTHHHSADRKGSAAAKSFPPSPKAAKRTPASPRIEEVVKRVPVKKIVEVPREVLKTVRKPEKRQVIKEVEVPGERIEVVKTVSKDRKVDNLIYIDRQVPVVVAQSHEPKVVVQGGGGFADEGVGGSKLRVEVRQINPVIVPVDIFVPVPVIRPIIAQSRKDFHRPVDVPAAQYNGLVRRLNPHLLSSHRESDQRALTEIYMRDITATAIPIIPDSEAVHLVTPTRELPLRMNNDLVTQAAPASGTFSSGLQEQAVDVRFETVPAPAWSDRPQRAPDTSTILMMPASRLSPWTIHSMGGVVHDSEEGSPTHIRGGAALATQASGGFSEQRASGDTQTLEGQPEGSSSGSGSFSAPNQSMASLGENDASLRSRGPGDDEGEASSRNGSREVEQIAAQDSAEGREDEGEMRARDPNTISVNEVDRGTSELPGAVASSSEAQENADLETPRSAAQEPPYQTSSYESHSMERRLSSEGGTRGSVQSLQGGHEGR